MPGAAGRIVAQVLVVMEAGLAYGRAAAKRAETPAGHLPPGAEVPLFSPHLAARSRAALDSKAANSATGSSARLRPAVNAACNIEIRLDPLPWAGSRQGNRTT